MNENREFHAELVEARANELERAWLQGQSCDRFRDVAAAALRREVEACEPLVKALVACAPAGPDDAQTGRNARVWWRDHGAPALVAHSARYAPAPAPTPDALAELAREAADMLDAPDVLGTHAQLSEARALAAKLRDAAKGGAR